MAAPLAKPDVFPSTLRTWIGEQLRLPEGGREAVLQHIMETYAQPLTIYFQGCSLRWICEPTDAVQGYFSDRLSRDAFLDRWLASKRPLRAWLIVGFKHYLYEQARKQRRDSAQHFTEDLEALGSPADNAFDRACAQQLVASALATTHAACERDDMLEHWHVFHAHYYEDQDYAAIQKQFDVSPGRASVMARTVRDRFRSSLRKLVGWEGANSDEIDAEIRALMEVLRP